MKTEIIGNKFITEHAIIDMNSISSVTTHDDTIFEVVYNEHSNSGSNMLHLNFITGTALIKAMTERLRAKAEAQSVEG
jgi:hypothetical protein